MKKIITLLLIYIFSSYASAKADEIEVVHGEYRASYDRLTLPLGEEMGLLGTGYLFKKDGWYRGLGIYSAVTGKRGGFFTGGLEFGSQYQLTPRLRVNASGFIGGGGGGAAPQGGGLMLREALSLEYIRGGWAYGIGVSAVQFPNGEIESEQLFLGVSHDFKTLFTPMDYDLAGFRDSLKGVLASEYRVGLDRYRLSAQIKQYQPSGNSLMTTGLPHPDNMGLVGAKLQYFLSEKYYSGVVTYGAHGGGTDGFAQVALIAGVEYPIARLHAVSAELNLGAAGGGRVDTGGGVIVAGEVGWRYTLTSAITFGVEAGYITAPDGEFSASSISLSMGYNYGLVGLGSGAVPLPDVLSFDRYVWRTRMSHQSYFPTGDSRRIGQQQQDDRQIDLFALQFDFFVTDEAYLTGQAIGAYRGDAGGYAVGLWGLGYELPITEKASIGAEVAVGAAGGGGLAVGDGLVRQYYLTGEYRVDGDVGVGLAVGRFVSEGRFEADLLQLSLNYYFAEPGAGY